MRDVSGAGSEPRGASDGLEGDTDISPAPEHLEDYRRWVRALFERYDGDGVDDMPGLVAPVRHWVLGGEWTGFWPGDGHDAYLAFAEVTREEALGADPGLRLCTIPFLLWEVFEGNEPSAAEIEVLACPAPKGS